MNLIRLAGCCLPLLITFPAAAQTSCPPHPAATENISAQLAKFRRVDLPYSTAGLSAREQKLVQKLVEAARYIDNIYWRQGDPEGLALYNKLAGCTSQADRNLRRFLLINGSRFDLLEENKPFVAGAKYAPGGTALPSDITQKEIDDYVAAHPEKKDA